MGYELSLTPYEVLERTKLLSSGNVMKLYFSPIFKTTYQPHIIQLERLYIFNRLIVLLRQTTYMS